MADEDAGRSDSPWQPLRLSAAGWWLWMAADQAGIKFMFGAKGAEVLVHALGIPAALLVVWRPRVALALGPLWLAGIALAGFDVLKAVPAVLPALIVPFIRLRAPTRKARVLVRSFDALVFAVFLVLGGGGAVHSTATRMEQSVGEPRTNASLPAGSWPASDGGVVILPAPNCLTAVHVWSTSCAPCLKDLPAWGAFDRDEELPGVDVVLVAVLDEATAVKRVVAERSVGVASVVDDGRIRRLLRNVAGKTQIPATIVLDRHGKVHATRIGAMHPKEAESWLRSLQDKICADSGAPSLSSGVGTGRL